MASLLRYRLEAETPSGVTYRWGTGPGDLSWTMTLDPRRPEEASTGDGDPTDRGVLAGKLVRRRNGEGDWPRGGAFQS